MLPLFVEIKLKESKEKTITINDIENAFKRFKKQAKKNDKGDYYIFISDRKLKSIFGFTDEEIEELHKSSK